MNFINDGNVTSPQGFLAAGVCAGLKRSGRPDLALIFSKSPATCAGAFTTNAFAAAPVKYCRTVLKASTTVQAVVINSGNANACTGKSGDDDTQTMADTVAGHLGLSPSDVLVFSTGLIGESLPMDKIVSGIAAAASTLAVSAGQDAARAIMTTDTKPKALAVSLEAGGATVTIGGIAKGAGMIAPDMQPCRPHATMLAFITTDAHVAPAFLDQCLESSLDQSFNRVTVDGDTSTNDSFVALANGTAGNDMIDEGHPDASQFRDAFHHVAAELAKMMVLDGEGATKFVEIEVTGAVSGTDAKLAARAVANSLLCKTAWFGADPNWGRILDAVGYSGATIDPDRVDLHYDEAHVVAGGEAGPASVDDQVCVVQKPAFKIRISLNIGEGSFTYWSCDLSYDYVKINADYHT